LPERITPWAAAASTGSRGGGTASSAIKTRIEHAGDNHTIPFSISKSILVILKKLQKILTRFICGNLRVFKPRSAILR
jgi:hypothetical protein